MRQGQQNRRGRGRNNNRKGHHHHNPLSRSFESNGPDVKIRGTPAHIAEKYIALARDAQSSGDPVLAENYLQHAEHYSRIIMAYREQLNPHGEGVNGNGQRMRSPMEMSEGSDEFGDDDSSDGPEDGLPQSYAPQPSSQPPMQPHTRHEGRQESGGGGRPEGQRPDRPFRRDHQGRHRDRFNDRGDRGDRGERPISMEGRPERQQDQGGDSGQQDSRRRDRFQQPHEQPEFLRRPVRRMRGESEEGGDKDETRD